MATERLNVAILVSFQFAYDMSGRETALVWDTKFKRFAVYYPTDADWKEKAELIHRQIVEKIGSKEFKILDHSFISVPENSLDDWDQIHEKNKLARKFEALLLWHEGKTLVEDKWLKANRPDEKLFAKSYTTPFGGL